MNRKERSIWLTQIDRIHRQIKREREQETLAQIAQIAGMRTEEPYL